MNEEARQAYLNVMGIQAYFPRTALSNAKAAPDLKFSDLAGPSCDAKVAEISDKSKPELSQSRASGQDADPAKRAPKGVTLNQQGENQQQTKGMLFETPLQAPQKVAKETFDNKSVIEDEMTNSRSGQEASSAEILPTELRFNLRYYRINQELGVISEIPYLQNNSHQKEALTLLRAILATLGVDSSNCSFISENFDWPLAENLSMKNDPKTEASNALQGFLKVRHVQDSFKNLLVFSNQLEELLLPLEKSTSTPSKDVGKHSAAVEIIRDFELLNEKVSCTLVISLHSMLSMPLLKREAWQQMQALRQRIAVNHIFTDSLDTSDNPPQSIF